MILYPRKTKERKTSSEEKRSTLTLYWETSTNEYLRKTVKNVIHLFNKNGYNKPQRNRISLLEVEKKDINKKWKCSGMNFGPLSSQITFKKFLKHQDRLPVSPYSKCSILEKAHFNNPKLTQKTETMLEMFRWQTKASKT